MINRKEFEVELRKQRAKDFNPNLSIFQEIAGYNSLDMKEVRKRWLASGCLDQFDKAYRNEEYDYPKAPEIKRISVDRGYFEANGRKYFIQDFLNIRRYAHYLRLSVEVNYGVSFPELYGVQERAIGMLTSGNDLLAAQYGAVELLKNTQSNVRKFDERKFNRMLEFCTLFINEEHEDTTVWDERLAFTKIEDWAEEGYAINDFFLLFKRSQQGLNKVYQDYEVEPDVTFQIRDIRDGSEPGTDAITSRIGTAPTPPGSVG